MMHNRHSYDIDMCATLVHIFGMPSTLDRPIKVRKNTRLVARATREDKEIISQAAAMSGQSVGSYILSEARKAAANIMELQNRVALNAEQSRRFVDALLTPAPKPTTDFVRAMQNYRTNVSSDVNGNAERRSHVSAPKKRRSVVLR